MLLHFYSLLRRRPPCITCSALWRSWRGCRRPAHPSSRRRRHAAARCHPMRPSHGSSRCCHCDTLACPCCHATQLRCRLCRHHCCSCSSPYRRRCGTPLSRCCHDCPRLQKGTPPLSHSLQLTSGRRPHSWPRPGTGSTQSPMAGLLTAWQPVRGMHGPIPCPNRPHSRPICMQPWPLWGQVAGTTSACILSCT